MERSHARLPIVGGNWKMNTLRDAAESLATELVDRLGGISGVEVVLCPPFTNLDVVHAVIGGANLQLGGQNAFWEDSGAFTGEISVPMLAAVGCRWVIVGHSERRHILGESDDVVNRKLLAVLRGGLKAIVAVGETGDERRAGRTEEVLNSQLTGSLAGLSVEQITSVVIAYEPCWAIGTGETATPQQANEAHAFCRSVLQRLFDELTAQATRIQYGGSVNAANAAELMAAPEIDGALVGGASLKPDDFAAIVRAAASS